MGGRATRRRPRRGARCARDDGDARIGRREAFDFVSIDVGSAPDTRIPGALAHALPVKPVAAFLAAWARIQADAAAGSARTIGVVGGGAAGVEVLLAMQWQLLQTLAAAAPRFALVTDQPALLPQHPPVVRARFGRLLVERGVVLHLASAAVAVEPGGVLVTEGRRISLDRIVWATTASAQSWPALAGLACDARGFIRIDDHLRSVSHPFVFAAGDCAAQDGHPRPKSGVFAVRQGPPLAANLRRAAHGAPLTSYVPQRNALALISTGDRHAIASRGPFVVEGDRVWRWKDRIDRRFMAKYLGARAAVRSARRSTPRPRMTPADATMTPTRITHFLLAALLALGSAPVAAQSATQIVLKPQQVSPHGWFFQGEAGAASAQNKGYMSNAGFVVTGDGVVVFDALGTPVLGQAMIAAIRTVTAQPIRRVIVSHYHADHIYGLQAFKAAGAEIWAHRKAQHYLTSEQAVDRLAQRRAELAPWVDDKTVVVPPDVWIDGDTSFRMGGRTFQLVYSEGAHSPEDLMMFVEPDRLLFAGDLIFAGRVPFVGNADSAGWLKAMDKMIALKPAVRGARPRSGVARRRARPRADARLPGLPARPHGRGGGGSRTV